MCASMTSSITLFINHCKSLDLLGWTWKVTASGCFYFHYATKMHKSLRITGYSLQGLIYKASVRTKRGWKHAYASSCAKGGIYKEKLDVKICAPTRKLWPMRTHILKTKQFGDTDGELRNWLRIKGINPLQNGKIYFDIFQYLQYLQVAHRSRLQQKIQITLNHHYGS